MTADLALPVACPRCSSLLLRGDSACRVCRWSADGVPEPAAPSRRAPATPTFSSMTAARSAAGTARAAGILAWSVCIAASVVLLLTMTAERELSRTLKQAFSGDSAQLQSGVTKTLGIVAAVGFASLVQTALYLATAVVTIIWSVRARQVALARRTYPQRRSETWAVVGWIVPVISLVVPFQVVTDIWHGSLPDAPGRRPSTPRPVAFWWGAFLASGALAFLARPHGGQGSNGLMVAAIATQCLAAYLFVNMLNQVSEWQQVAPAGR